MTLKMNHWVSKLGEPERCAACGEAVANVDKLTGIQVTGHCDGPSTMASERHLVFCSNCIEGPPLYGRYAMVELELPHAGFCHKCLRFVGDQYRPVEAEVYKAKLAAELERQTKLEEARQEQEALSAELKAKAAAEAPTVAMAQQDLDTLVRAAREQGVAVDEQQAWRDLRAEARLVLFETIRSGFTLVFGGFVLWVIHPTTVTACLAILVAIAAMLWVVRRRT